MAVTLHIISYCNTTVVYVFIPHYCTYQSTNWNICLLCYCHIRADKKYAPQMRHICHMYKLLDMGLILGKSTNTYPTYEVNRINNVTRRTVYIWRWQRWQCRQHFLIACAAFGLLGRISQQCNHFLAILHITGVKARKRLLSKKTI